jgi:hypothetical protein
MKKIVLADAPNGAIVFTDGRWGVVCKARSAQGEFRIVDFWSGGRERVPAWQVVEVQA